MSVMRTIPISFVAINSAGAQPPGDKDEVAANLEHPLA
jgi:hypothetical protein